MSEVPGRQGDEEGSLQEKPREEPSGNGDVARKADRRAGIPQAVFVVSGQTS